jgi:hypothetical protein
MFKFPSQDVRDLVIAAADKILTVMSLSQSVRDLVVAAADTILTEPPCPSLRMCVISSFQLLTRC